MNCEDKDNNFDRRVLGLVVSSARSIYVVKYVGHSFILLKL